MPSTFYDKNLDSQVGGVVKAWNLVQIYVDVDALYYYDSIFSLSTRPYGGIYVVGSIHLIFIT